MPSNVACAVVTAEKQAENDVGRMRTTVRGLCRFRDVRAHLSLEARVAGGTLTKEQNARVREALAALVARCGDIKSEAARQLRVNPSTVNRILSGHDGTSYGLVMKLAQLLGRKADEILGAQTGPIETSDAYPNRVAVVHAARLGGLPERAIAALLRRVPLEGRDLPFETWMSLLLAIVQEHRLLADLPELDDVPRRMPRKG